MGGVFLSPVGNTGTYCQGLCALQPINIETRIAIYKELLIYLTKNKRAFIVKITDWQLHLEPNDLIPAADWRHPLLDAAGLKYIAKATFYVDTQQSEESLWRNLEYKSCKYSINKARKLDLKTQIIEHADEIESFVDIHYRQIVDVCDRKGMKHLPYQNKNHLLKLCQTLFPNHILMIKVVGENEDNELKIMSTAIFVLGKQVSSYFTGASFRHLMKYCPNELMVWEAMKYLNKKGCGNLIFGDTSHYKKKFGTRYAYLPTLVYSSYGFIPKIRLFVKNTYFNLRHFIAKIKRESE